jgi:transposase-like protein
MCYIRAMRKLDAIKLLSSGNVTKAAKILGITRQALYKWPATLTQKNVDRVNGALYRIERENDAINRNV